MPKFYGPVGYAESVVTGPGVYTDQITERYYHGDVVRNTRRLQSADKVNDDINISNQFSILADPFAVGNFHAMRYIGFMGSKWKITDAEVQYPRLLLTVGGLYNEP